MERLEIVEGDIAELDVDAIANAANDRLWMGAGGARSSAPAARRSSASRSRSDRFRSVRPSPRVRGGCGRAT
jgi:O-acetyl-ADP-ribose deacetylase (regulator of RNase III)